MTREWSDQNGQKANRLELWVTWIFCLLAFTADWWLS